MLTTKRRRTEKGRKISRPQPSVPHREGIHVFDSLSLERHKLNEQIAEIIHQKIAQGKLNIGDRLPPERELAGLLKVNRATVREAIHLLGERGLVERKNGKGTSIKAIPPDNVGAAIDRYFISNNCSHRELQEVRIVLEPKAAALAALNANPDDVAKLGTALRELDGAWEACDHDRLGTADAQFHLALACASHNALIFGIANGLSIVLERFLRVNHARTKSEESYRTHRMIYDAVVLRDSGRAEDSMRKQMLTTPILDVAR